jgi:hypothetical protein
MYSVVTQVFGFNDCSWTNIQIYVAYTFNKLYTSHSQCAKKNTVKLDYSNIGFCDTLSIASNIQWYALIPHKATVFRPCLVRHAQMHQPRM